MSHAMTRWTNWVGNQSFAPAEIRRVANEDEAIAAVASAAREGHRIKTFGAGHSFTPVVETPGTLLDMSALSGVIATDRSACTATVWAQTPIHALGDALWAEGLALANQGGIDSQVIAGAIATGTHGSGKQLGSFSAALTAARLIDGQGELRDLSMASNGDIFPAFQTAIGLLGMMTQVTIKVVPAYRLHEQIRVMHVDEVLERWEDLLEGYRHFSFFWMPTDESAALYGFEPAPKDHCMVKLYREVPEGFDDIEAGDRVDRSYRIYPHVFEPNFHELEYFMALDRSREAFAAQRGLMLNSLPDSRFPLEVRFVAADGGWLSPFYKRPSIVMSISGTPGSDYWPYLRKADALFDSYDGRPHWGKLHFMTPDRLARLFPRYEDFKALRRTIDPQGLFLNPHLEPLFA